jgi:hypothetical protein
MQDARTSWPRTIRDTAGAVNIAETGMEYALTIRPNWFRAIKAHPAFAADARRTGAFEAILHPRLNG